MTVYYTLGNGQEIIDSTDYSFDRLRSMKRTERKAIKSRKDRERKEKIESIKLTIALFFAMVVFPTIMFLHWLYIGY